MEDDRDDKRLRRSREVRIALLQQRDFARTGEGEQQVRQDNGPRQRRHRLHVHIRHGHGDKDSHGRKPLLLRRDGGRILRQHSQSVRRHADRRSDVVLRRRGRQQDREPRRRFGVDNEPDLLQGQRGGFARIGQQAEHGRRGRVPHKDQLYLGRRRKLKSKHDQPHDNVLAVRPYRHIHGGIAEGCRSERRIRVQDLRRQYVVRREHDHVQQSRGRRQSRSDGRQVSQLGCGSGHDIQRDVCRIHFQIRRERRHQR